MEEKPGHDVRPVAVLGLGRFGGSLARTLAARGITVLGVDSDPRVVARYADDLSRAVVADTTDEQVLHDLAVAGYQHAVVGIGAAMESSILTTALVADLGIGHIWAKAITQRHAHILRRVGAHHVVSPEHAMGERVAHLAIGSMVDFIEFDDDYAVAKTGVPREVAGHSLSASSLRTKYDVTVIGIKHPGESFTPATADSVVHRGDLIVVSGPTPAVERFANEVYAHQQRQHHRSLP